jgi:ABC-type multidrug transport system fused ATPase/permease subunit
MYFIYGAPFEIFIAAFFLYQLLGLSAFAGFLVLILGWPLNSFITSRSIRIQRGLLAARDKRMNLLNELLNALKFVKFFAWEERWAKRVFDARKHELDWLIKSRLNNIMLQALWSTAPILVSVISFMTFVVQGNKLTVGTAFTAIALFNMVRAPLNTVPMWIVQVLQTRVALKRIEVFLDEDEVDHQVSTLKTGPSQPFEPSEFGLRNASFKWNAVEEKDEGKDKDAESSNGKKHKSSVRPEDLEAAISETIHSSIAEADRGEDASEDRVFELRDMNVSFPEGVLSVVTGPTASGKTALLVRSR